MQGSMAATSSKSVVTNVAGVPDFADNFRDLASLKAANILSFCYEQVN